MHHILINSPAGWSVGLLYEESAIPQYLEMYLKNMRNNAFKIKNFSDWLINHNVRALAFCLGDPIQKAKTLTFCNQFNKNMKKADMLVEFTEFAKEVEKVAPEYFKD